MIRKAMALAVGLGLVAAVGTQASAQPGYPPHGGFGYRGGWHGGGVYRGPVYRGGWGVGYGYAPHRVWYPGYWTVRPWGRVWIAGCWR
jgi:hypothetical protein